MKDRLVTFNVARVAREKGFNGKCRAKINCSHYHFVKDNIIPSNVPTSENELFAPMWDWNNHEENDHYRKQVVLKGLNTSIPTQSLLSKWIRDVKFKHIEIHYMDEVLGYGYQITDISTNTMLFDNFIYSGSNYEDTLEAALIIALNLI